MEQGKWVEFKAELTEVFKTKTRDEWCDIMEGSDVCFAPVLALDEVPNHPHHVARDSFIELDGIVQPAPAPRFSRSEVGVSHGSRIPGEDTPTVLPEAGLGEAEITELVESAAGVNADGA